MNVSSNLCWKFIVYHTFYFFNIQSSWCQICCQKIIKFSLLKLYECLNSLGLTQVSMQFTGLKSQQIQDNCHPMTLFFCFEKDDHFFTVEIQQNRKKGRLPVLVCILSKLYHLLMKFFGSFLNNIKSTLSGSAEILMGFEVVAWVKRLTDGPKVALNKIVWTCSFMWDIISFISA